MPTVRLTRNYHFSASHRLHLPQLSDAANQELFGRCNNPHGHGHNYMVAITVEGEVRTETGLVVNEAALNALVRAQVVEVYDHKYINRDLPEFATLTATTENMAVDIRDRLLSAWPAGFPALARIRVQETKRNVIELPVIEEVV
jgi:6-pyruvoyltetrahydropterin/6-carboxytetrahydropterin synthase